MGGETPPPAANDTDSLATGAKKPVFLQTSVAVDDSTPDFKQILDGTS